MTKWTEPGNALDVPGVQQPIDHVEDEQRLHSVIREAFPRFGEGDVGKTAGMPDEAAILRIMHELGIRNYKVESRKQKAEKRISEIHRKRSTSNVQPSM